MASAVFIFILPIIWSFLLAKNEIKYWLADQVTSYSTLPYTDITSIWFGFYEIKIA